MAASIVSAPITTDTFREGSFWLNPQDGTPLTARWGVARLWPDDVVVEGPQLALVPEHSDPEAPLYWVEMVNGLVHEVGTDREIGITVQDLLEMDVDDLGEVDIMASDDRFTLVCREHGCRARLAVGA